MDRAPQRLIPGPGSGAVPRWWRLFLFSLFAAAVGWRLVVFDRLASGPLLGSLSSDGQAYWEWASRIRSGQWVGGSPFFLGPLYPFWLALVRSLIGDSIPAILLVQCAFGSAAVVLVTDIVRRLASTRAAVIVGITLAGYSMLVLFDLLILMESLVFFLGALWLWCCVRSPRSRWLPVAVGLLIGLMSLGRPTGLILLVPYAFLVGGDRPRVRGLLALAQAVAVVALACRCSCITVV